MKKGKVDALLGIVFGDEGKGKVVDVFTPEYDVVARFAGGPNAGHTIRTTTSRTKKNFGWRAWNTCAAST